MRIQEEAVKETCLRAHVLFSPGLLSPQLEALQEVQALLGRIGPLHTFKQDQQTDSDEDGRACAKDADLTTYPQKLQIGLQSQFSIGSQDLCNLR